MKVSFASILARLAVGSMCLSFVATASTPPLTNIDHIILGVANLEDGIEQFEKLTGVRPVHGGKHPTGTHNALVSLGGRTYVEILAPQPDSSPPPDFADLPGLKELTPVGWALSSQDVARLPQQIAAAGLTVTGPKPGSRAMPQGGALHWVMFDLTQPIDAAPFFIAWREGSSHPSATSPGGCTLTSWSVAGPEADILDKLRTLTGSPVEIAIAPAAQLSLVLACPKGAVTFASPRSSQ
jgi:hypothetical protein